MIEYTQDLQDTDVPYSECKRCDYSEYVHDEYATGDSPSGYVCNVVDDKDCPYMAQFEIDVDKLTKVKVEDAFKADHPEYQDAFITYAEYYGDPLNEQKLDWLNNNHPELILKIAPEFSKWV